MTPNKEALLALADRVEAATGGGAELGREVLLACGWSKTTVGYFMGQMFRWSPPGPHVRGAGFHDDHFHRHNPLTSLDAAMMMIPDGRGWTVLQEALRRCALATENGTEADFGRRLPAFVTAVSLRALAHSTPPVVKPMRAQSEDSPR